MLQQSVPNLNTKATLYGRNRNQNGVKRQPLRTCLIKGSMKGKIYETTGPQRGVCSLL